MKKLLFLLLFSSVIFAAEVPKLAFGTMQSGDSANVFPGGNVTFKVYFFVDSEYGNRITHITLNVTASPPGWSVVVTPQIHQMTIIVNGVEKTITETLYVEPKPVLNESEMPSPKPNDTYYLLSPSGKGYLQAKMAEVSITVPSSAVIGSNNEINVEGIAQWYGEGGVVLFSQSRDFKYTMNIASPQYTEEIIKPNVTEPQQNVSTGVTKSETEIPIVAVAAIVLLVMVGAYYFLGRRKQPPKSQ
jgi:hypothetical protein